MKKKVTSTDIAKAAGVSQATVSMVLNKKYNVSFSKETIQKVEETAREMGYNIPKRRPRKDAGNSRLIIVFCPTLTNPYYVMLLQGIEKVAKEKGYAVFTCDTQRELKLEEQYLKMMHTVIPAGIIYTFNPSPVYMSQVEELAKKIPLVIISNRERVEVDAINQDNTKVGSLMARHLLDLGHRDVAFIAPPLTKRQQQRSKRVAGFVEEYEKEGLGDHVIIKAADDALDDQLPSIDSEYRMGFNLTKEILAGPRKVTAFAGLNDMMAFGIMDALQEEKYKIPGDVSVLGCDNIIFSGMSHMSLTTIEHFVPLKGRDACDIIMRKIESFMNTYSDSEPTSIYHIEYEPKLIVRKTTGYVKQKQKKKKKTK
ncbi:MAG: LacI family DNA-binding transcriptional regulator [Blautia producta]|uniref:LacI family transcriptional regulator n=2 Tax=Blautia producta TaxID=33035 RepID=A0A7G5N188_9FIRM|nr:LacI family DNA-binding transcriptional regulator [Blautia producta]MDU5221926.1 LacI family DNA-binding transcriptional regulator [Blautia producta]MDU5383417.1 LacI family DNA-binding transcriptional regulator [Blautia producta]MDU6884678.1 LacI family DNA-binding transcriptional regulator [Blautia producta]QIB56598.1 LacI family transcriptional regulator [Blautia producta ATCC 27340 = DSM 2950]QMW80631.1 LacI family transcriptional regulator [Blautia producta]